MKKLALVTVMLVGALTTYANPVTTNLLENKETVVMASQASPFCMAIVKGDLETVKKLIELGEDINQRSLGLTPVMYAAKYNRCDILKLLIEKGANLKAKDSNNGFTALRFAELSNAKEAKAILEAALNA